jgi:hypothetical protein
MGLRNSRKTAGGGFVRWDRYVILLRFAGGLRE